MVQYTCWICGHTYDGAEVILFDNFTEHRICPVYSATKQHFTCITTSIFAECARYIEIHPNNEIHT